MQIETYKRGEYPRGHEVLCKHCGWSWKAHESPERVPDPRRRHKGFRLSFSRCSWYGYEPENIKEWQESEKTYQEDASFRQECFERQAQGDAAWGMYAALRRDENGDRSMHGMMVIGAGGPYRGEEMD